MPTEKRSLTRRFYLFTTSLALAAGAALGHWNGKQGTQASFVQDCSTSRFSVVYDKATDEHRHFHCFEIDAAQSGEPEKPVVSAEVLVL